MRFSPCANSRAKLSFGIFTVGMAYFHIAMTRISKLVISAVA